MHPPIHFLTADPFCWYVRFAVVAVAVAVAVTVGVAVAVIVAVLVAVLVLAVELVTFLSVGDEGTVAGVGGGVALGAHDDVMSALFCLASSFFPDDTLLS